MVSTATIRPGRTKRKRDVITETHALGWKEGSQLGRDTSMLMLSSLQ